MFFTYKDELTKRKDYLTKEIAESEKKLKRFPQGEIYITKNRNASNWYLKKEIKGKTEKRYLAKKQRVIAETYANKKYISLKIKDDEKELAATQAYLKKYDNYIPKSKELLQNEKYRELLIKKYYPTDKILQDWMNEQYEKCSKYPEKLIHKCISGNVVRSKSEELIDTALFKNNIAYRYESELRLGEKIIYPDFTIMKRDTMKIIYWEHFGMMDDINYKNNAVSKIKMYIDNGILPFENLIITYETQDEPLGYQKIENIIKSLLIE